MKQYQPERAVEVVSPGLSSEKTAKVRRSETEKKNYENELVLMSQSQVFENTRQEIFQNQTKTRSIWTSG